MSAEQELSQRAIIERLSQRGGWAWERYQRLSEAAKNLGASRVRKNFVKYHESLRDDYAGTVAAIDAAHAED